MTISPQGWAYEVVSGGGERVDGFVLYDVRFWTSPERQRDGLGKYVIDGVRCDLANNFKMQIRENHQRIKTLPGTPQEPDGFMLHASGVPVPMRVLGDAKGLGDFLKANGNPARSGYPPFIFPTYAGVGEELSNEWQHETYTLPLLPQAEANIERYITVAKRLGKEGDERGTTLNLQVGASSDDAHQLVSDGSVRVTGDISFGNNFDARHNGLRFTGVSGLSSAAVSSAILTFVARSFDSGAFVGDWFAEDAAAPSTFITTTNNITDRTQTTATQEGDGTDFGDWETEDIVTFEGDAGGIKGLIQELADSYDPSSIVLLHIYTSGTGERVGESYNTNSGDAPKLDITFTAGAPTPTAALTGTALPTATEAEIAAGGETVIITLTDDTWLDAGGAFDGSRQAIIDGFDAATTPTNGWNNEVRDKAPTSVAVRTNATTVTMTWTNAASAYDISSAETITVTIPASALTTSADPVVADETFEITVVAVAGNPWYYYAQQGAA